jgi:hypothetical protein
MTRPDRPDEGHIADTGMFRRFVAQEQQLEQQQQGGSSRRWMVLVAQLDRVIVAALELWLVHR